jgi:hypothetical protein
VKLHSRTVATAHQMRKLVSPAWALIDSFLIAIARLILFIFQIRAIIAYQLFLTLQAAHRF